MKLIDSFNRKHDYLRISLTDRCNYNCIYCNPNRRKSSPGKKNSLLTFEEIERIIEIFTAKLEFKKIRFTGGEPFVRKDLFSFFRSVNKIKQKYNFKIGLTTNGSLIYDKVDELKRSGIDYLNISIDSLNRRKFEMITGSDDLPQLLKVIEEAEKAGFNPVKLNAVVIKNINDNEILDFIEMFKDRNVNVRFIEFMPFGSNEWVKKGFISFKKMKSVVESKYKLIPVVPGANAIAKDFKIVGARGKVSFISSISNHFCSECNRVRISADGTFRLCLFSSGEKEINFKNLFRNGANDEEITQLLKKSILTKWEKHPDVEILSKEIKNNMMEIGG